LVRYTKKQLSEFETSKRIIYLIHNKVNRKNYVGQTVKTFNQRYSGNGVGAERVLGHTNKKLQEDLEKYGPENFRVTILEQNIEDINTLNKLEKFYIKKYNCITKGYNTLVGGDNLDKDRFYEIRREIKDYYLQALTIDNIMNDVYDYKKLSNGAFVQSLEIDVDIMAFDPDLHPRLMKKAEYWKEACMEVIDERLKEACELGFDLTLNDVLCFYKLIEG
jgi:hypothetical protein